MNTAFGEQDYAFQQEVRAFLDDKYTPQLEAELNDKDTMREALIRWHKILYAQGWIAPNWPKEYGGTGWNATQKYIFENEVATKGAPDVLPFGLKMVGPVIYQFGNDEQKQRFLPDILQTNTWWCQGYSETGAGSDLAALQTRAVRDGDDYVVNGTKIWTTYAQYADMIFCLVKTDTSVKPQQGISFLLIDMKNPGVSVRPIISIDGRHSLNEVQFDNVRVPLANRIGEENKGWTYAKALLAHERTAIAGVAYCKRLMMQVKKHAAQEICFGQPLINDSFFQKRLSDVELELMALEYTELRVLSATAAGESPGVESSLLKIRGTEMQQACQSLLLEVAAYYGAVERKDVAVAAIGHEFGDAARAEWMYGRACSIYGGSNEIQKNIIAKYVLGL